MTYLLFILWLAAIFAIYSAICTAIDGFYHYEYLKNIASMLKDKSTQQLLVHLEPYFDQYLNVLQKNTDTYAKQVEIYKQNKGANKK